MVTTRNNDDGDAPMFDALTKLIKDMKTQAKTTKEVTKDLSKAAKSLENIGNSLKDFKQGITGLNKLLNKNDQKENKRDKESRERSDKQYAVFFAMRGLLDKIARATVGGSTFLSPHAPQVGGMFGSIVTMALLSVFEAFTSKFFEELKANNNITLEAFKRGLSLQGSVNLLAQQTRAMPFLKAEERQSVLNSLLGAQIRDFNPAGDSRITQLAISKVLGENLEQQADLFGTLKFTLKQSATDQVKVLNDIREVSRSTGASMDKLVSMTKQSIDATKSLYSIVGPERYAKLTTAISKVSVGAGAEAETVQNLLTTLLKNPQASFRMGVNTLLDRLGKGTEEEDIALLGEILNNVRNFTTSVKNLPLMEGQIVTGALQDAIANGVEIFEARAGIDAALQNLGRAAATGQGEKVNEALSRIIPYQDPERMLMVETMNKFMPDFVAGAKNMVFELGSLKDEIRSLNSNINSGDNSFNSFKNEARRGERGGR